MKVAVSSSGRDLDAQIAPRFGRCAYTTLKRVQIYKLNSKCSYEYFLAKIGG